jgi:hypothetical protein
LAKDFIKRFGQKAEKVEKSKVEKSTSTKLKTTGESKIFRSAQVMRPVERIEHRSTRSEMTASTFSGGVYMRTKDSFRGSPALGATIGLLAFSGFPKLSAFDTTLVGQHFLPPCFLRDRERKWRRA